MKRLVIVGALCLGLSACTGGIQHTTTARAAEETLLVSTAAQRAVSAYPAAHLAGKQVWLDESYYVAIDREYVISALREHLAEQGALLVREESAAELVLEIRNGTLGVNDPEWTLGIPSIPISYSGQAVTLPKLAIGYDPQDAWAKLHLWTYDARSGENVDLCVTWGQAETGWFQSITPSVIGEVRKVTVEHR